MAKLEVVNSIYSFNANENDKMIENARRLLNHMGAMSFLIMGVTSDGNFSIHSQLHENDLKELLEKVIKALPDGKAIVPAIQI
jgi:hypothetical protein